MCLRPAASGDSCPRVLGLGWGLLLLSPVGEGQGVSAAKIRCSSDTIMGPALPVRASRARRVRGYAAT